MKRLAGGVFVEQRAHDHLRHEVYRHHVELLLRGDGNYGQLALEIQLERIIERVERCRKPCGRIAHDLRRTYNARWNCVERGTYELLGAEFTLLIQTVEAFVYELAFEDKSLARSGHVRSRNVHEPLKATDSHALAGEEQDVERSVHIHLAEALCRFVYADFGSGVNDVRNALRERVVCVCLHPQTLDANVAAHDLYALPHLT